MIDGRFLTGKNGTAGELGHIPVDGSDIPCGCGNYGCIENLAGGKYLAYLQKNNYPDTDISELFTKYCGDELLTGFVDRMAVCVAVEVNILDPDYVIVGGGVLNMKDFLKSMFLNKVIEHTRKPYPAENLNIILADDEPEKSVAGAVYYAVSLLKTK